LFVPDFSDQTPQTAQPPDYERLVRFLVEPFLEQPETLKVDCETRPAKARVWVRLAFADSDKGRVFGRGGRTIQSIRTVLEAAAQAVGHSVHLEIYGERDEQAEPSQREAPKRSSTYQPPIIKKANQASE
jgi:uncharacterized protein